MTRINPIDPVAAAAQAALRSVPPMWPLKATVAVNPFLGLAETGLATASARLASTAGVRATMPRDWYAAKVACGDIADDDLAAALAHSTAAGQFDVAAVKTALSRPRTAPDRRASVADLAAGATGLDWPGVVAERIGHWAAGYFDEGQALWAAPRRGGAWSAWRTHAHYDVTPEIIGLAGFCAFVADTAQSAPAALKEATGRLQLSGPALQGYFETLLAGLGGWAQLARQLHFEAELEGRDDDTLIELLVIRAVWDAALLKHCGESINGAWIEAVARHAEPIAPTRDDEIDAILQEAAERAEQRRLAAALSRGVRRPAPARPLLQAAFCIDVRSEVYRRALEEVDAGIETLGFAGFFGLPVAHRDFASDVTEKRLPVLLNPALRSQAGGGTDDPRDRSARFVARAKRAFGRFKLAAVSSFAFVEAMGPVYVGRLARDTLRLGGTTPPDRPQPRFAPLPDLKERVAMAASILSAMSLKDRFAPIVLLVGHGAAVTNNPHASALQCGACGGHSGEVNARLLAAMLNDGDVRSGLLHEGIDIPADTVFVAALHDTTTDRVTIFDAPDRAADLASVRGWLARATTATQRERSRRLPGASARALPARARDWAQTRPEWGLAGCSAFIAAPRARTAGRALEGRAFLHDYAWQDDPGFRILELILTAPVVVASWISLQYYGSVVAPEAFGGGNKLLHNVVGGVGVVEGNGGILRSGLPWQSVHDGERFAHDPLRLTVMVEAPREAITDILARHPQVKALFDNGWLHLLAMEGDGGKLWRHTARHGWRPAAEPLPQRARSMEAA